jgi:hypothetical protein
VPLWAPIKVWYSNPTLSAFSLYLLCAAVGTHKGVVFESHSLRLR